MSENELKRVKRQHLTDVDIGKILGLGKALLPKREIAALIHFSQKAVQHTLPTYMFETFQGRNPRRNYPRKTSQREDRYIERHLKQNSDIPLHDIINLIELPISKGTVRRRRSETGLGSYIAAQKPGLRPENVVKRLDWAERYKD